MTKEQRDTIEYKANRILDIFSNNNMADMPLSLFSTMANEYHILTTILENQSVAIKKGGKK